MTKVLLVEDDNNLREIYEARLAAEGYEISTAKDGEDALAIAKQVTPDLIISDVMMPRISGFEMLDILRNTDGLKHTKIIMLTALGQAEDKTRADTLGADKYLVKSQVTLEDIVKAADQLLNPEKYASNASEEASTPEAVTDTSAPQPSTTPSEPPVVAEPVPAIEPAPETPAEQPVISPAADPAPVEPPAAPSVEPPASGMVAAPTDPVATDNTPASDDDLPVPMTAADTNSTDEVEAPAVPEPAPAPETPAEQPVISPAADPAPVEPPAAPSVEPPATTAVEVGTITPVITPVEPVTAPETSPAPVAPVTAPEAPSAPEENTAPPVIQMPQPTVEPSVVSAAEAQSTSQENATVEQQIKDFESTDTTEQTLAATPELGVAGTAGDSMPTETAAAAPTMPAPEQTAEQPAPADGQPLTGSMTGKKVIQPISNIEDDKTKLETLLAAEQAKEQEATGVAGAPVVGTVTPEPAAEQPAAAAPQPTQPPKDAPSAPPPGGIFMPNENGSAEDSAL